MTITTTVRLVEYDGGDSSGPFAYSFKAFLPTDIKVTLIDEDDAETVLVYGTDYTVDNSGTEAGGTVTTTDPVPSGTTIRIERYVSLTQGTSNLVGQGPYFAQALERALDYLTMITQQLSACIYRVDTNLGSQIVVINNILIDIDSIENNITNIQSDLTDILSRLDALEARMTAVEGRLDVVEGRLDSIEDRLDALEEGGGGGGGGFTNPMTEPNDMIVGGVGGAATRLAHPVDEMGAAKFLVNRLGTVEWDEINLIDDITFPTGPFEPVGAIPYINADGDWAKLSPGNEGDILTLVDGLPEWTAVLP